jgi:hypothetical protein
MDNYDRIVAFMNGQDPNEVQIVDLRTTIKTYRKNNIGNRNAPPTQII